MAINLNKIFADALLDISLQKSLKSVTIKMLLEYTGASKQAFYNRFRDKAELITWIYENYVLSSFRTTNISTDYYHCALDYYHRIRQNYRFMSQALSIGGQNGLRDFMLQYSIQFDLDWLKSRPGTEVLSDEIIFASRYNSMANMGMAVEWIQTGMPKPPEFIAYYTTLMKKLSVGSMVSDAEYLFDGLPDTAPK